MDYKERLKSIKTLEELIDFRVETIKGTFTITIEPDTVTKTFEPEKEPQPITYTAHEVDKIITETWNLCNLYNTQEVTIQKLIALNLLKH